MAKWGFDLDGTLDHPEILRLANFLYDKGEEVHVLTGFVPTGNYTEEMKLIKLRRLGVRCTKMHLCEGETMEDIGYTKAQVLNRLGIDFMVDDDPVFVKQIAHYSRARILMVVR
jgi:hypothetical protein